MTPSRRTVGWPQLAKHLGEKEELLSRSAFLERKIELRAFREAGVARCPQFDARRRMDVPVSAHYCDKSGASNDLHVVATHRSDERSVEIEAVAVETVRKSQEQ